MDIANILIWNVRGLNKKAHRDVVRQMVTMVRLDVVCLQETKVESTTTRILLTTLGQDFDQHVVRPAQGTRGGILIAWKRAVCQTVDMRVDVYSASIHF